MQTDLFLPDQSEQSYTIPLKYGEVRYYPRWLAHNKATQYFDSLQTEISWRQDSIKLFGKMMKIPRLQAWHGEAHCRYAYSGLTLDPEPFSPTLSRIKSACEDTTGKQFNCVLANWYRNGQDSMSYHADDEPELGPRPVIASVTLGAERAFDFKHKNSGEKHRVVLQHGSLLVMSGRTQQYYLHGIAKSTRISEPRINLTYRYIQAYEQRF